MNSITQDMRFRLSVVLSYYRVGATKTAIRYKVTRQFVYFWVHRYHDDDIRSLADRSHRPSHHPNQHSDLEIKWIKDLRRRNPDMGLIALETAPWLLQVRLFPLPRHALPQYVPEQEKA